MVELAGTADALVVGGGPAGLSAALYLARYLRSVVVFDSGDGRSTHHQVNHNYLGFPDGVAALELRALGRKQLLTYPHARVVPMAVAEAERGEEGVTVSDGVQRWHGRVLVLATGVADSYPTFPGWEDYVGSSLFWCITCDGYENRGRQVVVVGNDDTAAGEALQLRGLTPAVQLLTNSPECDVSEEMRDRLDRYRVPLVHDLLEGVRGESGDLRAVVTAGGAELPAEAIFSLQGARPRVELAEALGVELDAAGYVVVGNEQRTSVPGVYAAGDVTCLHSHQVAAAVHEGAQAASAAHYDLLPPDLRAP